MNYILLIFSVIGGLVIGGLVVFLVNRYLLATRSKTILEEAEKEAEVIKKNKLLEVKEKFIHMKAEMEKQANARNAKIQSAEAKLKQREMQLSQQQQDLQKKKSETDAIRANLDTQLEMVEKKKQELEKLHKSEVERLEHLSGISAEEAKERLVESLKEEAKTQAASYINDIMDDAKMTANKEAKRIVIQSIQRVATETAIENSVTVFHIESDEIKGRIIGREGRNIRTLETLTGVDLIIDDTPEAVVLSAFDPVRREIAKIALEKLIQDGRIHPVRIEETVEKSREEVEKKIMKEGENAALDMGIMGLNKELIKNLGRLYYRTSYGQNVLKHSLEVGHIAGMLAAELGANVYVAKRAGLLHDIGKAVDQTQEGTHIQLGVELASRYGEKPEVIHAIEAHHDDVTANTIEAVLVKLADAISAGRPGARRDTLEIYIKRLQKIEEIVNGYEGIKQSFAVQAGREVRVIVQSEMFDDLASQKLARDIAKKIEDELDYPGQIKVTVVREFRTTEIAK